MTTAIWIIIALVAAAAGYLVAANMSKKSARSAANTILDDAKREADVIKEKRILQAKEEEMKILGEAEKVSQQKFQKAQAAEARAKQREMQLNQQQGDLNRRRSATRSR